MAVVIFRYNWRSLGDAGSRRMMHADNTKQQQQIPLSALERRWLLEPVFFFFSVQQYKRYIFGLWPNQHCILNPFINMFFN